MQSIHALAIVLISLFTAALQGCPDHNERGVAQPAGNTKFFKCTACLADTPSHCVTNTPVCGDLSERSDSEVGAKNSLCDTLSPAELARRPTPTGFKPNQWFKNACYKWPDDAFTVSCTTFTTTCAKVPIH